MAGIPPLAGFFGKYYLLLHAQEQGLYILAFVALATSLVSTYYYLRLIKIFWFENNLGVRSVTYGITRVQEAIAFISGLFLLAFITFSSKLLGFFDALTIRLFG
jgi:NADH-quinone oxidoreductase subunit N